MTLRADAHLVEHVGDEALAAPAGVHAHHQQEVDLVEVREHRVDRGLGVQHQPDADVPLPHLLEERARVAELDVHDAAVGAGVGEAFEQHRRVVDHEVAVEEEVGVLAQRAHHDGPDREVGHEVAVHHVDVEEVGGVGDPLHLRRELGEVGRQDRRRQLHGRHGTSRIHCPDCSPQESNPFSESRRSTATSVGACDHVHVGHETGGIGAQVRDHLGHFLGLRDASDGCPHVVGHPAGVGDRRVHDVGGDAELGELRGGGERVALERPLRRAVRDLLGEAVRATGREPDDATPRGAALDVPAGELGDQERARARVHAQVAIDGAGTHREHRAAEAIDGRRA